MYDLKYVTESKCRIPVLERLMSKVTISDSGCHIFTGCKDSSGYGMILVGGKRIGAHKVSCLLHVGDYDQKNLELMHSCDNPACVNPDHLKPATHKYNMHDCINKGRFVWSGMYDGVLSRKESIAIGLKTYTGSACKIHGTTERSVVNGACVDCREQYRIKKMKDRENLKNSK